MGGFTPSIPYETRRRNELITLLRFCQADPSNRFWRARLLGALKSCTAIRALHAAVLFLLLALSGDGRELSR
jgi:hypothetical protein